MDVDIDDEEEEEEFEHCGCCKRDSAKILAGGRAICLSVDNYPDNNYNQDDNYQKYDDDNDNYPDSNHNQDDDY